MRERERGGESIAARLKRQEDCTSARAEIYWAVSVALRYELLRRKTQQPLASSPPEDFNRWYHVYAGDKLFHEDKGLSR